MKTLNKHVILYDDACPMCNLYTNAFVKYGFLEKEGRATYQNIPNAFADCVDQKRAANEIALIHTETGKVTYGVKSLMKILANRFPVLKPLFKFSSFYWLANKSYRFVSFNRRIIMPSTKSYIETNDPSFHLGYRIAFLFFTWIIASIILSNYSKVLYPILSASNLSRELFICGGQIIWQVVVIQFINKKKCWDYLGNLMTISFGGAFLLSVGLLLIKTFSHPTAYVACSYFLIVVGLMFLEHIRRTHLLQLPWTMTVSWVLYRCLVLYFIL